jgi:hypothetical protein
MGAESYRYVVDYEENVQNALDKLREKVFESGEFHGAELNPKTPEEAFRLTEADGTRSILDISRVSDKPGCCRASPLRDKEMKAIAAAIIGGTLLNGGVGNLFGSPIGALTLLIINELIRAAGVHSNFQAIVSGLLLYIFIVLQSVVMSLRGRGKFRLALPSWLPGRLSR